MFRSLLTLTLVFLLAVLPASARTIHTAYVRAWKARSLSQRSDLCNACKLWVNPYFKSVIDTVRHMPLVTHYVYTKVFRIRQEKLQLKRVGIFDKWLLIRGQVYEEARMMVKASKKSKEIQKGHCQPWILLAYTTGCAILTMLLVTPTMDMVSR